MRPLNNFTRLIFVLFCLCVTTQCGGEGDASKIKAETVPDAPLVLKAGITLNEGTDNEISIDGAWFRSRFRIFNDSDQTITVQSITLTIWTRVNGQQQATDFTIDGSDLNRLYLAEIEPNGKYDEPTEIFFVESLPDDADNFRFRVQGELLGWFGPGDDPQKRLSKRFTFYTE